MRHFGRFWGNRVRRGMQAREKLQAPVKDFEAFGT
jgi:hypothetical protein